jgi:2-keto-4-pentenoate hydratase/2-oxohepta-3-ene-1,7-dioic acid hydratase in catechol pathway
VKLATFLHDDVLKAGFIDGDDVVVVAEGAAAETAVLDLIASGKAAVEGWQAAAATAERLALGDVRLLPPMPRLVRDVICVGKNYHAHAREFHGSGFDSSGKEELPSAPVIFTKAMTGLIGPGEAIRSSLDPTGTVDFEGELGVVIGRKAARVSRDEAMDYVFGYVIVNDMTSRELQRRHSQWTIGKGLDTFCPMGPWIATADEMPDLPDVLLQTFVNGEERQRASLADLIFDIPTIIETLTATGTLLPGDVIATGTPAGVGIGFTPPRYLKPGDRVKIQITGLGTLENPVA